MIGKKIRDFLPEEDLLSYSEAILRVYNLLRPARQQVQGAHQDPRPRDRRWRNRAARSRRSSKRIRHGVLRLPEDEVAPHRRLFRAAAPTSRVRRRAPCSTRARRPTRRFDRWVRQNVMPHRVPGYAIVTISLKPIGGVPGDATAEQMDAVADLAERYSLRRGARQPRAEPRSCRTSRSTTCRRSTTRSPRTTSRPPMPGSSPTSSPAPASTIARSPTPARSRSRSASPSASPTPARQEEIGDLKIKISGCINACGHHHVGHIGILGVEKKGEEFYQITLGGSGDETRLDRRDHRHGLLHRRDRRRRRDAGRHLSRSARERGRDVPRHLPPPRPAPFKEALYGAA